MALMDVLEINALENDFISFNDGNGLQYISKVNGDTIEGYTSDYGNFSIIEIITLIFLVLAMVINFLGALVSITSIIVRKIKNVESSKYTKKANLAIIIGEAISLLIILTMEILVSFNTKAW